MANFLKFIGFIIFAGGVFVATQVKNPEASGTNYGMIILLGATAQGALFFGLGLILEKVEKLCSYLVPQETKQEESSEVVN